MENPKWIETEEKVRGMQNVVWDRDGVLTKAG